MIKIHRSQYQTHQACQNPAMIGSFSHIYHDTSDRRRNIAALVFSPRAPVVKIPRLGFQHVADRVPMQIVKQPSGADVVVRIDRIFFDLQLVEFCNIVDINGPPSSVIFSVADFVPAPVSPAAGA